MIAKDIFDLSNGGRKLNPTEVLNLPTQLCYVGPTKTVYKSNVNQCITLLLRIFGNANKLQDKEFPSFSVGKLLSFIIRVSNLGQNVVVFGLKSHYTLIRQSLGSQQTKPINFQRNFHIIRIIPSYNIGKV